MKVVAQMPEENLLKFHHRFNEEGQLQLKTGPLHDYLASIKSRGDFVVIGFTNIDLYPGDDWNSFFGEAPLQSRHRHLQLRSLP